MGQSVSIDPLQLLMINAGVAGVVVVLILVGWLWSKPSVEREFKKADARETQQQALIDTMLAVHQTEVLPTFADMERRLVPLLTRIEHMLQELEWRLSEETQGASGGRGGQGRGRGRFGEGPDPGDYPPPPRRPQ